MAKVKNIPNSGFDGDLIKFNKLYIIEKNTRLFQICAPDLGKIIVNIVDNLTESTRDTNGFGSTGLKIN
jgi:dUTPase